LRAQAARGAPRIMPASSTAADARRAPVAELAAELRREIRRLAPALLPRGVYAAGRRQWRCGSTQGEPGGSLCVWLDGPGRGKWIDYASGEHGDALDLIAAVRGLGGAEARAWAAAWLGGSATAVTPSPPARQDEAERERREAERQALRQQQDARRLWLAGTPISPDDPAWRYLAARGVDLARLERPPAALRCHPGLWNAESGREWPALVAAITGPGGAHLNTHRIWLEVQAARVTKAPLSKPKLSMPGSYAGGCVRLWRGASGKPWREMPPGETLAVGEGIEDVLSFATLRPDFRCVAVLSVSGLARVQLPAQIERVLWIAQRDPPGSPAARALGQALRQHRRAGRRVAWILPPPGTKDLNELVAICADDAE
jgi:hypothetical protein